MSNVYIGSITGSNPPSFMKTGSTSYVRINKDEQEVTVTTDKPIITKKEEDALLSAAAKHSRADIVRMHVDGNLEGTILEDMELSTLIACLYIGYQVEQPHPLKMFFDANTAQVPNDTSWNAGYRNGIRNGVLVALKMTGQVVKGINDHE